MTEANDGYSIRYRPHQAARASRVGRCVCSGVVVTLCLKRRWTLIRDVGVHALIYLSAFKLQRREIRGCCVWHARSYGHDATSSTSRCCYLDLVRLIRSLHSSFCRWAYNNQVIQVIQVHQVHQVNQGHQTWWIKLIKYSQTTKGFITKKGCQQCTALKDWQNPAGYVYVYVWQLLRVVVFYCHTKH